MTKEEKIRQLISYLLLKVEERDWHAVSDAANDLRVMEVMPNPRKYLADMDLTDVQERINFT